METVYLDTETTGVADDDEMVELTILDDDGEPLINTLIKPNFIEHGLELREFMEYLHWMLDMLLRKMKYQTTFVKL